jgi:glutamyl-tRNA synthetase
MEIKVRFAPSPTGFLHVGGLRTALFNYLYAKKVGGKIILRIEDTDQSRKVDNAVENLISTFDKLNINYNEGPSQGGNFGPYFQSKRKDIYKKHIDLLIKNGNAYPCFCSSEDLAFVRAKQSEAKEIIKYSRKCLQLDHEEVSEKMKSDKYVIRMKVPSERKEVIFFDMIRDRIAIKYNEIDDQILIKSDGFPTYHFANVVDDYLMGITHVMRGEEWLPSTPKHILLYHFFDWKLPKFIHLPLLLNSDKSKLSKRQGDVAVEDYLKKGFLPEALLNFVALLGWNPKNEKELFNIDELKKEFSIKRINKSGAVFDYEKLKWMNSQYLKNLPIISIIKYSKPFFDTENIDVSDVDKFKAIILSARDRSSTLIDIVDYAKPFYRDVQLNDDKLSYLNDADSQSVLLYFLNGISTQDIWTIKELELLIKETSKNTNVNGKNLYSSLRLALLGDMHGPDIPLICSIIGVKNVISRLKKYIAH